MGNYVTGSEERFARPGTKTRRKERRSDARMWLGTSSDPAPNARQILLAIEALKGALDMATDGRFGLAIHDFETGEKLSAIDARILLTKAVEDGRYNLRGARLP